MKLNHQSFFDQQIELDQFHTFEYLIDKLTSSHFYEIELNQVCDLDSQICDPVQISESLLTPILLLDLRNILELVLILIPVILELESPILESHILLWENERGIGFQLLDLDPLPEQILTVRPLLNFSQFPESNVVHILPDSRSIIPSFHIPFWDKGVKNNDSEISLKF